MEFELRHDLYKREKYLKKIRGFYHECEIIKVITGVRRCGKSSIMNLIIQELVEAGIKVENIALEQVSMFENLDDYGDPEGTPVTGASSPKREEVKQQGDMTTDLGDSAVASPEVT